jgi:hypothetical protein
MKQTLCLALLTLMMGFIIGRYTSGEWAPYDELPGSVIHSRTGEVCVIGGRCVQLNREEQ